MNEWVPPILWPDAFGSNNDDFDALAVRSDRESPSERVRTWDCESYNLRAFGCRRRSFIEAGPEVYGALRGYRHSLDVPGFRHSAHLDHRGFGRVQTDRFDLEVDHDGRAGCLNHVG